jgi:myo-inositol 2-dehydrogenase/D-chiro-inositol 1-dehydrogenase
MGGNGRVRVGVIGIGSMGAQHAANLCRFAAGAELAAVQDLDRDRAARFAAAWGGPRVCATPDELIQGVDAVLVAAPDARHAELVLACIEAGRPVLCEKPLAAAPAEALRVVRAECAAGRRSVAVGFHRRFDPYHLAVKALADAGGIGRPLLWKGVHRNAQAPYHTSGPFILMNTAGHDIDSARWLLGAEVLEVSARGLRSRPELPETSRDLLVLQMAMSGDRLATAEITVNAGYGYEVSAELVGQSGTVTTAQPDRVCLRAQSSRGVPVGSDWTAPFQEAYLAELLEWVDAVAAGRPFAGASAWDGYLAMTVSAAAAEALASNRPVRVEPGPRPELYA